MNMNDPKPQNILDSPQWVSQSTATALPEADGSLSPSISGGPQPPPVEIGIGLDKSVACCPKGATCAPNENCRVIVATGYASRDGKPADGVTVTVTGPDGSENSGSPEAVLVYTIRESDCGQEGILFVAAGAGKKAEAKADVVEVKFNNLGDPHRVGISKSINRTQHLSVSVSPKKYTENVELTVDAKLTISKIHNDSATGTITFDLVGNTKSITKGDSWIKATVNAVPDCEFIRKVSVVVPAVIARPHDEPVMDPARTGPVALGSTTAPALHPSGGVPLGSKLLAAGTYAPVKITVLDQFTPAQAVGDLYGGSPITEDNESINVALEADSTYIDTVGFTLRLRMPKPGGGYQDAILPDNDPRVNGWAVDGTLPAGFGIESPPTPPFERPANANPEVDGIAIEPITGRKWRFSGPPVKLEVIWP